MDRLTIVSESVIERIMIVDVNGVLIDNQKVGQHELIKDLSQLNSGIYLIRVIDENGDMTVKKIVKLD